jgi:glycosidase
VVYQIAPHSLPGSGGAGDLREVIARIPYLASLGIDAVWLSPFDPSALVDGEGGVLSDFDEMTCELAAHGIKLIADAAPDEMSSGHPWFTEAVAAPPGSPAADQSIFRDELGQAFTFDLLEATWPAGEFLRVITDNLTAAQQYGASTTWVLSSYGAASRRARAAALLMLALPGSVYLYQGEELGLPDGAETSEHDPDSTLNLYRQALGWRHKLQGAESLEWMPGTSEQVLHFGRPGGWRSVTNLGRRAVPLPPGTAVMASASLETGLLPPDTTAWIIPGN